VYLVAEGFWFAPETEETFFLSSKAINEEMQVEARAVRNIFRNAENGYSVYDVEDTNHRWFKISGYFPTDLKIDAYYTFTGLVKDGKYGRVLQVTDYHSALPRDEQGIITMLRTLPRLDTRAPAIYDVLGEEALEIILSDPDMVAARVKWVSKEDAVLWQKALKTVKEADVILQTLQSYQIPSSAARQLLEKYPDIIERLKRSPYFLIEEVRGFGFQKCDRIALENGYPFDGEERLQQAMLYVLRQDGMRYGNCYMEAPQFSLAVKAAVDIRIDFRTAQELLRKRGLCEYLLGTRKVPIDRGSLTAALKSFREHPGNGRFFYSCAQISDSALQTALSGLRGASKIVVENDRVYLGRMYEAETAVARCLKAMTASEYGDFPEVEQVMDEVCREEGVSLEKQQREAVLQFCSGRGGVFVLNGRAGCGKTFTLNIIIKVLDRLYRMHGLCFSAKVMAPTGKAAQVAHNSTGLPASTVHRALHLVADGLQNTEVSIGGECVVIDEFSMMGLSLSAILLKSIAPGVKTIIMGDFEQLPSIDPGNVLRDIIASGMVPVVTLDVVKRQAEGSGILQNANKILNGEKIRSSIVNEGKVRNNAFIFRTNDPIKCRNSIIEMVMKMRKRGYRMDDIQVLCPQKKTDVGIDSLNYFLQERLNPPNGGKEVLSKMVDIHTEDGSPKTVKLMFREGDKVIHTANNYDMKFYNYQKGVGFTEDVTRVGIVNGETGRIAKIIDYKDGKTFHKRVYVQYGKNQYAMYEDAWDELSMAYAMTIHRAQGSQWPIVIAPVMLCNRTMLTRGILYTLYTRAQESSMLYGTEDAIQYAIGNNPAIHRNSWLKERLREAV